MKIGKVDIRYDEQGNTKSARFVAEAETFESPELLNQISEIKGDNEQAVLQKSILVLSTWLTHMENKLSEIELADREQFEISGEVVKCEKTDDKLKSICVEYSLKKLADSVQG